MERLNAGRRDTSLAFSIMQSCVVTRNRTPTDVMLEIRVRPDRAFRHRCLAAKECKIRVLGNDERDDESRFED